MIARSSATGDILAVAACLLLTAASLAAGEARAQPAWLKQALRLGHSSPAGRIAGPKVARYVVDEGGGFVLDREGRNSLIRFDDNPEVIALVASRGPRGDILYCNDVGDPVLRVTRLGGVTVFTPRRPEGSAAAPAGPAPRLALTPIGPVALYQRLVQASVRASRAAQHLVAFEADQADPASDSLIADTAGVAMMAIVGLATHSGGRAALGHVDRVALTNGSQPQARMDGAVLRITVAASQGWAGRPSSERIVRVMTRAR